MLFYIYFHSMHIGDITYSIKDFFKVEIKYLIE